MEEDIQNLSQTVIFRGTPCMYLHLTLFFYSENKLVKSSFPNIWSGGGVRTPCLDKYYSMVYIQQWVKHQGQTDIFKSRIHLSIQCLI